MDAVRKNLLEECYDRVINVGFCLEPYQDLSDMVDPNVMIFGTTKDEKVFSLEELIDFFQSQYKQMEGIKPSLQRKRLSTQISEDQSSALIAEELTLNLVSEEINNSLYLRTSCVLQYSADRWKLTHWHASTPVETENDHWHMEEWKRENEKLQKLVDQQTADLQDKYRELEIEAALERVRARTMAMQHSDELMETSELMFEQVKNLGIELWSCGFSLWYDDDSYFLGYNPGPGGKVGEPLRIPLTEDVFFTTIREAKRRGDEFLVFESKGDSLKETYRYMDTLPVVGETMRGFVEAGYPLPTYQVTHCGFFSNGHLMFILQEKNPEATKIFKRFTKVFNQTYTRFLDLQKAEAQALETEIELALERVRARTMSMQKSEELADVAFVLFEQLRGLGGNLWGTGFGLCERDSEKDSFWFANENGVFPPVSIPNTTDPAHKKMYKGWENNKEHLAIESSGEHLKHHYEYMMSLPEVRPFFQKILDEGLSFPEWQQWNAAYFTHGYLLIITHDPYPNPDILKRFARVFDQTYTRFLDLKKAEAQALEAQIEAALERVRSRSLAMHKPDELQDVVRVVAEELKNTGIILDTGGAVICTYFQDSKDVMHWTATEDPTHPSVPYLLPYFKDKLFDEAWESKNRGDDYFAKEFSFDVKNNFWKHAFQHSDYRQLPDEYKKIILESQSHGLAWAWAENSAIMIPSIQGDLPSDDQKKILIRFAKVFEQSFIRFLDLQKAEEQAREAKIEAALEKVRSRSLAMHKSDELNEVVKVLFEKMTELEVPSTAVAIQTFSENSKDVHCFVCGDVGTGIVISQYLLPYFDHPILEDFHKAREKKLELYVGTYSKKEKDSFYDVVLKLPELKDLPAEVNSMIRESEVYEITMVPAKKSVLTVNDFYGNRLSDGQVNILKRFAKVFDQAYTRFLDLQKAEAQNRQAQINLALERVRARSLAMQKPDDLNKVNEELLRQLQELHIDGLSGVSIWLIDKEGLITAWDLSNPGNMRDPRSATLRYDATKFDLIGEPWRIFNSSDMDYVVLDYPVEKLRKAVKEWAEVDTSIADEFQEALDNGSLTHQWNPLARHSHGFLSIDLVKHPSDGIREIVTKMAGVFSLAYRRFLDLQKAEEQAREAQIELSLERIRSQVTAMQESSDLLDIVVTMRTEFVNLGHEAQYFWHMRWLTDHYKKAMTSGDGTKIGMVMTLPRHIHGNIESVAKWEKSNESTYVLAMEVDEAVDYIDKMITLGDFEKVDPQAPTLDDIRHIGGLTFIMARTTHGEIGYSLPGVVPNPPTDALDTLVSFAGVFDLAYKRFEDLKAAEQQALLIREERDRLEVALKELHATQDQLVQQEKLASLGQLTAGIAHEIKNPLNFVNNFSELSAELIQEVREEIESVGAIHELPLQDVYDILDDIEANLTTIHKHGSRADSIVKSMLEHSRGGSGKMEPTDLNSLLKEYVNLSFHGMRAGKDPINVDLQFDLDESVTEVPLIAEDFSRVIINLSNNAFDAMRSLSAERSANDKDYKPKLTIRTHQIDSGTTIEIEDNGGGIPNELKGKILQPFFTTKKGTEGTGLGLSITNDIIKAHKGTLDVRSSENGSIFTIHLPIH